MEPTILVNRRKRLSKEDIPIHLREPNIPFYGPIGDSRRLLEEVAAKEAESLFTRAWEDGVRLYGISGYRSYERQEELYRAWQRKNDGDVLSAVAPPGASEHQTGLALDVSCLMENFELEEHFGETREGKWLVRHAPLFGFILRYPKGKEQITEYPWEPWHIRYVTRSLSLYLALTGLTLEEYYEQRECLR